MRQTFRKWFPRLAALLWVWFLLLDVTRLGNSTGVKLSGICLCALAALVGANTPDGRLVAAAMLLTVGADWFLLVRNDHFSLGVGIFLAVQGLYALRLYRLRHGKRSPADYFRGGLLLLFCLGTLIEPSLLLLWMVLLYFCNLCMNTVEAMSLGKNGQKFAVGLFLFLCCDLCVGGWNLSLFLPRWLSEFCRVGMWLFYLPSQVLIVLSQEQKIGGSA